MPALANRMPPLEVDLAQLADWGRRWCLDVNEETGKNKKINAFDKKQSVNFAFFLDHAFAESIGTMLGGIPIVKPIKNSLIPPQANCVELGNVRIIGGVRPQNYDAAYRPDGPRIVFDSKTLNDTDSVRKNWQNMINDLATEATTVHTRYPYAIVVFLVVIPRPALLEKQQADIIRTLERLGTRQNVLDQHHLAESISLIVWDPGNGLLDHEIPEEGSNLCLDSMPDRVYAHYVSRYKGLPPHESDGGENDDDDPDA
jgi:hypothetical protein